MIGESQAAVLDAFWPPAAQWFLIGGPADDNEARYVYAHHDVLCVGFEPNPTFVAAPAARPDPFPGPLLPFALWEADTELWLTVPAGATARSGSVCRPPSAPDMGGAWAPETRWPVQGRTLDRMSDQFGPFRNAVLWLDVEYAEVAVLRGARRVLEHTLLVNVETYPDGNLSEVEALLNATGLFRVHEWGAGTDPARDARDYVFARRG